MCKQKKFRILKTGAKDSDNYVYSQIGENSEIIFFKLRYTAPYNPFDGIKQLQLAMRFHPFQASTFEKKNISIDLSEWHGHIGEEYLEIFFKYIHDLDDKVFEYNYIFTVADFKESEVKTLFMIMSGYFSKGESMNKDYYSDWAEYAYEEERRFISDKIVKKEISEGLDIYGDKGKLVSVKNEGGDIPILIQDKVIYTLKDGHTLVQGESGSKKSRSVVRPEIMVAAMKRQSIVITDPKGELASDGMLIGFIKSQGIDTYVLDMRDFNKSGFNFLEYPLQLIRRGNIQEASTNISRFVHSLIKDISTNDDYWNNMAVLQIELLITIILWALAQKKDGDLYANLSSVVSFIAEDKECLITLMEEIAIDMGDEIFNPAKILLEIYKNPEKTYACINSSAVALLRDFITQENLTKMLSVSSFDIKEAYRKPMAVFLVIPDETQAFNHIAGELVDNMYQQLISEYTKTYQNNRPPECQIYFILDEFCNIRINDMAAKLSAARSREIFFTLIYQSDKQLEKIYEDDAGTIKGNCKNFIFLGSSDYDVLSSVSDMTGITKITRDGSKEAVVTVEDLRKMKKSKEYKDALLIRDNIIYCANLLDYAEYDCLAEYKDMHPFYRNDVDNCKARIYTPELMVFDLMEGRIKFPYSKQ